MYVDAEADGVDGPWTDFEDDRLSSHYTSWTCPLLLLSNNTQVVFTITTAYSYCSLLLILFLPGSQPTCSDPCPRQSRPPPNVGLVRQTRTSIPDKIRDRFRLFQTLAYLPAVPGLAPLSLISPSSLLANGSCKQTPSPCLDSEPIVAKA